MFDSKVSANSVCIYPLILPLFANFSTELPRSVSRESGGITERTRVHDAVLTHQYYSVVAGKLP
jgi:hypothetical protein